MHKYASKFEHLLNEEDELSKEEAKHSPVNMSVSEVEGLIGILEDETNEDLFESPVKDTAINPFKAQPVDFYSNNNSSHTNSIYSNENPNLPQAYTQLNSFSEFQSNQYSQTHNGSQSIFETQQNQSSMSYYQQTSMAYNHMPIVHGQPLMYYPANYSSLQAYSHQPPGQRSGQVPPDSTKLRGNDLFKIVAKTEEKNLYSKSKSNKSK